MEHERCSPFASPSVLGSPIVVVAFLVIICGVVSAALRPRVTSIAAPLWVLWTLAATVGPPVVWFLSPQGCARRGKRIGAYLVVLIVTGIRFLPTLSPRPPSLAFECERVVQFEGVCRDDLRPSSATIRVLEVELDTCRTREGWKGSAAGIVRLVWRDEVYIQTVEGRGTVVPLRGDRFIVEGTIPAIGEGFVWVDSHGLRCVVRQTPLATARRTLREGVRSRLGPLSPQAYALSHALLLGTREGMESDLASRVRQAGVSHVIALSGMHLGVIATIMLVVLSRCIAPIHARWVTLVVLCFYVWVAGMIPSLLRALLLFGIAVGARSLERVFPPAVVLSLCVVGYTVLWPTEVLSAGFQLSILALMGIFLVSPSVIRSAGALMPGGMATYLGTSFSAVIATAPYSLIAFGALYPVGILVSGAVSAVIVVVVWLVFGYLAVAGVPLVGSALRGLIERGSALFYTICEYAAHVEGIDTTSPMWWRGVLLWSGVTVCTVGLCWWRTRQMARNVPVIKGEDELQLDF